MVLAQMKEACSSFQKAIRLMRQENRPNKRLRITYITNDYRIYDII